MSVLNNSFWATNGIPLKKSFADFVAHQNFDENVVIKWDEKCFISDIVTWDQSYGWIPSAYTAIKNWFGSTCYAVPLEPLVDDSDEYILDDNGYIIFAD